MGYDIQFWRAWKSDTGGDNTPVLVDEDNPLPVRAMGPAADLPAIVDLGGGSFVDRSGTIAAANVAQDAAPPNGARRYLFVQIPTTGAKCWVDYGVPAVAASPSIELLPGDILVLESYCCTQKLSILSATAGAAYTVKEG